MGRHPDVGPTGSRSPGRSGGGPSPDSRSDERLPSTGGHADAAADSQVAAYAGLRRRHRADGASRNGERHAHPAVVAGSSQPFLRARLAGCTPWSRLEPGGRLGAGERRPGQCAEQQGGPAEGQFQGGSVRRVADQPVGEPEAARVRGAGPRDTQMAVTGPPEVDTTVTADDLRAAYRELAGEQAIGFTSPAL
jgi:hypothetical protein